MPRPPSRGVEPQSPNVGAKPIVQRRAACFRRDHVNNARVSGEQRSNELADQIEVAGLDHSKHAAVDPDVRRLRRRGRLERSKDPPWSTHQTTYGFVSADDSSTDNGRFSDLPQTEGGQAVRIAEHSERRASRQAEAPLPQQTAARHSMLPQKTVSHRDPDRSWIRSRPKEGTEELPVIGQRDLGTSVRELI